MTEPTEPTKDPQNTPEPDAAGGGEGNNQPEKRSFTQAELDALFAVRTKSAKQTAVKDLLAELGVESPDAIKTALAEAEQARKAQMTELEQAQAEAQAAKEAEVKAKAERDEAIAQANETLMKAAVMAAARDFNDPADAWLYIDRSKIEMADDGEIKGVEEALKIVVEAKPYLVKAGEQAPPLGTPKIKRSVGQQWQQQQQTPAQNERPLVNL